jgi:hypothetical protein
MANTITAGNATNGGTAISSDTSGTLELKTGSTPTTALTIDASQRAVFVAGTAAAPAITTSGNTNTGIFFSAADTIDFAEGGVATGQFDSSGNFKFNSGYGSVATAYGCRAWVNFNGTGTVAIRAAGNVSSITDSGVGNYIMNFTTAMPDTNYCCTMNGRTGGGVQSIITVNRDGSPTTTTNPIYVVNPSTPGTLQDEAFCMIAVFR